MPLFDKPPPSPRRTLWDRIAYALCAFTVWAAVIYQMAGG